MVNRTRIENGIVSMILLHDMINRWVVILYTYYYITILRTNTNTMTRIEGENVGIVILFNKHVQVIYIYLLLYLRSYYGKCKKYYLRSIIYVMRYEEYV